MTRMLAALIVLLLVAPGGREVVGQTDLDELMERVLARRDDNWKKLQQYVLDEHESVDLHGSSGTLWGEQRDYTWFIRDGYFIRSPVKANGVPVPEGDRRAYEAEYLRRAERRERRAIGPAAPAATPPDVADPPRDVGGLLQQTREPQFVSSAYFLRFRFEGGKYAFVGREQLDGRELLRIEYYPANLFPQGRRGPGRLGSNPVDAETRRLLNKVAIVTLWIEPTSKQIVKYTFDNVDLDFLPAQWLVRVSDVRATMSMEQPFPDVWLPREVEMNIGLALAIGEFGVRYRLSYHDYRRADATSTLRSQSDR